MWYIAVILILKVPAAENIHCFNESEAHVERMEDENLYEERLEAESSSNEETLEQSVERVLLS